MKGITSRAQIEMSVTLTLTEAEARALSSMTAYGADSFIKAYRKHLGKAMAPHEHALPDLFESINYQLPQHLKGIDAARNAFNDRGKND